MSSPCNGAQLQYQEAEDRMQVFLRKDKDSVHGILVMIIGKRY